MIEGISERFYEIVSALVPLNLAEAESEVFPYAVYDHRPAYYTDKCDRAPYKADTDLQCAIYGKDFDELLELAESVASAVLDGMNDREFASRLTSTYKDRDQDTWSIQMYFFITQMLQ